MALALSAAVCPCVRGDAPGRTDWPAAPGASRRRVFRARRIVACLPSTLLSQERTLSAVALGCVAGIVAFWWFSGQMLEDSRLLEATWIVAALAVLGSPFRVIVSRLNEGLDQIPLEVRSVTWLGKHQITWVFNLVAPFLLARFIGDQRRWVSSSTARWAVVGLANYLLLARMGLLVFVLATLGVCLLNAAHWRRWIVLMGTAAAGAAIVIANNLRITTFVASTFLDRALNSGIDLGCAWKEALDMFQTHPIAGIGLGTFDKIAYQMPATVANRDFQMNGWHAHNVPLHILTEAGVLGLAAWVFLWYVIVHALVRAWRTGSRDARVYAAAALVSVAAFQILSMTEVLIAARVQASLQMNLMIALLMVLGLRCRSLRRNRKGVGHAFKGARPPISIRRRAMMQAMRGLLKFLFYLILLALIAGAGAWFWAGRLDGPAIEVRQPGKFIGQASSLEMMAQAPGGAFSRLTVAVEQGGKTYQVFALNNDEAAVKRSADRLLVMRPIGKRALPELKSGPARIVVNAARPVLMGLRNAGIIGHTRRAGAARTAAADGAVHVSFRQSRWQRVRRLPRDAGGCAVRRPRRRQGISLVPGVGYRHFRGIPHFAWRSSRCSTTSRRTRESTSSRATRPETRSSSRSTTGSFRSSIREPH